MSGVKAVPLATGWHQAAEGEEDLENHLMLSLAFPWGIYLQLLPGFELD